VLASAGFGQKITVTTSLNLFRHFPVDAVEQCFSLSSCCRISSNKAHQDAWYLRLFARSHTFVVTVGSGDDHEVSGHTITASLLRPVDYRL
jgi:hypothetical protein